MHYGCAVSVGIVIYYLIIKVTLDSNLLYHIQHTSQYETYNLKQLYETFEKREFLLCLGHSNCQLLPLSRHGSGTQLIRPQKEWFMS